MGNFQIHTLQKNSHVMKTTIILLLILAIIAVATTMICAQPLPPSPSQAPIDGGLGLLAVAGGAYAIKKIKNKKAV